MKNLLTRQGNAGIVGVRLTMTVSIVTNVGHREFEKSYNLFIILNRNDNQNKKNNKRSRWNSISPH